MHAITNQKKYRLFYDAEPSGTANQHGWRLVRMHAVCVCRMASNQLRFLQTYCQIAMRVGSGFRSFVLPGAEPHDRSADFVCPDFHGSAAFRPSERLLPVPANVFPFNCHRGAFALNTTASFAAGLEPQTHNSACLYMPCNHITAHYGIAFYLLVRNYSFFHCCHHF